MTIDRRTFISQAAALAGAQLILPGALANSLKFGEGVKPKNAEDLFTISLSQWCYHRAVFGDARDDYSWFLKTLHSHPDRVLRGPLDPREIVSKARSLDVDVVDLVNILWFGHGSDKAWLADFRKRASDEGVSFGVLMCDELGNLGASDRSERSRAVNKHIQWMNTAAELGCVHFRVNAYGDGSYLEQCRQASESLHVLAEAAEQYDFDILVENHGHPGSNGAWLSMLIEMGDHSKLGAFADFDNFFMGGWNLEPERRYDREQGMRDLAPHTRAVSAKTFDFDEEGEEKTIDFSLCLEIALEGGFRGLASAEYEGEHLSEEEGTRKTVELLRTTREKIFQRLA